MTNGEVSIPTPWKPPRPGSQALGEPEQELALAARDVEHRGVAARSIRLDDLVELHDARRVADDVVTKVMS